jgi:hypothetical protein
MYYYRPLLNRHSTGLIHVPHVDLCSLVTGLHSTLYPCCYAIHFYISMEDWRKNGQVLSAQVWFIYYIWQDWPFLSGHVTVWSSSGYSVSTSLLPDLARLTISEWSCDSLIIKWIHCIHFLASNFDRVMNNIPGNFFNFLSTYTRCAIPRIDLA